MADERKIRVFFDAADSAIIRIVIADNSAELVPHIALEGEHYYDIPLDVYLTMTVPETGLPDLPKIKAWIVGGGT